MYRKRKHINYVRNYLIELKYDTLNKTFRASMNNFSNKKQVKTLKNNTLLIQKYQRRLFLLKF